MIYCVYKVNKPWSQNPANNPTGGNNVQDLNRATYQAWKEAWLSSGKTLDDAVEAGRRQGGDTYAERLKLLIKEMESPLKHS